MKGIIEEPQAREMAIPASIEFYHAAFECGMIDEKTELLEGLIVQKMPKSPLHFSLCDFLRNALSSVLEDGSFVRSESPLTIRALNSEPEPDVMVVNGRLADYLESHPETAEFVAEIALTTAPTDRQKARIYAAAGVREFWLILPESRSVEVFREPDPENQCYQGHEVFAGKTMVGSSVLASFSIAIPAFFSLEESN